MHLVNQHDKAKKLFSVHILSVQFKKQLTIDEPKMKTNKKKSSAVCQESLLRSEKKSRKEERKRMARETYAWPIPKLCEKIRHGKTSNVYVDEKLQTKG